MAKKKVIKKSERKSSEIRIDGKIFYAFLGVFTLVVGFIIAMVLKRDDEYVMYYSKHGLVLFIGWLIAMLFSFVPILNIILWIPLLVLWILTWLNALSGKEKRTIIITDIAEKIEL